jgi:hypothetical protein
MMKVVNNIMKYFIRVYIMDVTMKQHRTMYFILYVIPTAFVGGNMKQ